eukprot:g78267.t1
MVYDVRRLRAARFRFTDKGDVEAYIDGLLQDRGFENAKPSATPCTEQEPQPANQEARLRQWPLRKLAGELIWPIVYLSFISILRVL